jgi:peptidoglycan hydrolase CwlO-like protein
MEQVLLEKQELDTIKELQKKELDLVDQLGRIEYQIQSLELEKEKIRQEITQFQTKSREFGGKLQQKYGDGNINVETGEFTKIN